MSPLGAAIGALFGVGFVMAGRNLSLVGVRVVTERLSRLLNIEPVVVSWIVVGSVIGSVTLTLIRGPQAAVFGIFVGGGIAFAIRQQQRETEIKQLRIQQSLVTPAFLDMLAISMATGVGLRSAMASLLPRSDTMLQSLWQPIVSDGDAGLVDRLQRVVSSTDHSPTQRIANALIVSTERGTPIVDLLQSLAQEIRSEGRRQLLEIAAKKDVQMMLPVVFGILPSITAIALFPAVGSLTSLT